MNPTASAPSRVLTGVASPSCPQDYARRRTAFGSLLIRQPLAQRTLGWLHLHTAASLALTLEVARLQGG